MHSAKPFRWTKSARAILMLSNGRANHCVKKPPARDTSASRTSADWMYL